MIITDSRRKDTTIFTKIFKNQKFTLIHHSVQLLPKRVRRAFLFLALRITQNDKFYAIVPQTISTSAKFTSDISCNE